MLFPVYSVFLPIYTPQGIKEGLEIILDFNKEIEFQLKDVIVGFKIGTVFSYDTKYSIFDEEIRLYNVKNKISITKFKDRTDILGIYNSFTIHIFKDNYILILDSK